MNDAMASVQSIVSKVAAMGQPAVGLQDHGNMLCSDRTSGVFIYECKDNQEYKEIVLTTADVPMLGARKTALAMWDSVERKKLFEPLEKCIDHTGWQYNSCPFRDRCLSIHEWGEVSRET